MPDFVFKSPDGLELTVTGDTPPSEQELDAIFSDARSKVGAKGSSQGPEGSAIGRFAAGAGEYLNPISMVSGAYQAVRHPLDTASQMLQAQVGEAQKAKGLFGEGRYTEAAGHLGAAVLPIVGPMAARAGEAIASGDIAGGLGQATGLIGTSALPSVARGATKAVQSIIPSGMAERAAQAAETASSRRFAQVMSPSGSSKEIKTMGKQAEKIAQDVRRRTTAITPEGLHAQIADQLDDVGKQFDDFYKNTPDSDQIGPTAPFIARLQEKRAQLARRGTGGAVFAAENAERVKAIDTAIDEVRRMGSYATSRELSGLMGDWKEAAKDAYVPSVAPGFQQIRAKAKGYADARSAFSDGLIERHPELEKLNPNYSVLKQANDVMTALEDTERVRPTVGRTIMARGLGAATGAAAHGATGGIVGAIVAPLVERGISTTVSPAIKLLLARQLGVLADAIRSGAPPATVNTLTYRLRPLILNAQAQQGTQPVEGQ